MKRTQQAAQKTRQALEKRRLAQVYRDSDKPAQGYREAADALFEEAEAVTRLQTPPAIGHGKEAVPASEYLDLGAGNGKRLIIRETLETPDAVSTEASIDRLDCLIDAGSLELGLDVADAVQAENSVEKMLAHQLGTCHKVAMTFMGKAMNEPDTLEQTRLANTASRLIRTFQDGILALQKLKTGGQQTMVVQHVQVKDGGQAVVTGRVDPSERGDRAKK